MLPCDSMCDIIITCAMVSNVSVPFIGTSVVSTLLLAVR